MAGFQIPYEIKESQYGGRGLFATARIPIGTCVWQYVRDVNVKSYTSLDEIKSRMAEFSSDAERYFFISHVYLFDGVMNEILDDGKMWNHVSFFNSVTIHHSSFLSLSAFCFGSPRNLYNKHY